MHMLPNFLQRLNERLDGIDSEYNPEGDVFHNIFIVGAPRSGTTVLSQLFAGCSDAGYVNNLMASFWKAPVTGALLSERWMRDRIFTGCSIYGQTNDISEPHEFGAFWRDKLQNSDMVQRANGQDINWRDLLDVLNSVSIVFGRPMVYKVFQLFWYIREFHQASPNGKWLWIQRDTVDNALSLLDLRRHQTGNINQWVSAKPLGAELHCDQGPHLEVVAQVQLINNWLKDELSKLPENIWRRVTLESLTHDTERVFEELCSWAEVDVMPKNLADAAKYICPEILEESEDKRLVRDAYKRFMNGNV
jgi:hypothetical protein